MKKNLKNISLAMLLATSSGLIVGMHKGKNNDNVIKNDNTTKQQASQSSGSVALGIRATIELSDAANTAARSLGTAAGTAGRALGSAGEAVGNALRYKSTATSGGEAGSVWNFSTAAETAGKSIDDAAKYVTTTSPKRFGSDVYKAMPNVSERLNDLSTNFSKNLNQPSERAGQRSTLQYLGERPQVIRENLTFAADSAARSLGTAATNASRALGSAGEMAYNAPGNLVARATGAEGPVQFMSNARQSIRTAADNANKVTRTTGSIAGKDLVVSTNRTYSNLPVRMLDSTLTAIQNLPNTAAARLTATKKAVETWFSDTGNNAASLSSSAKTKINSLVAAAGKLADPSTAYNYVKNGLNKMFGTSAPTASEFGTSAPTESEVENLMNKTLTKENIFLENFPNETVNNIKQFAQKLINERNKNNDNISELSDFIKNEITHTLKNSN